jgi:hypothetical protein
MLAVLPQSKSDVGHYQTPEEPILPAFRIASVQAATAIWYVREPESHSDSRKTHEKRGCHGFMFVSIYKNRRIHLHAIMSSPIANRPLHATNDRLERTSMDVPGSMSMPGGDRLRDIRCMDVGNVVTVVLDLARSL